MENLVVREARPGEPSLVVHFYYKLFEEQFDFLPNTERYFLHAMEEFLENPVENVLYIVESEGKILGSICVVKIAEHEAQIRLFGTSPDLQGRGMGFKLMQKAMEFCKSQDYRHLILWTIDICQAARHLYGKFGFNLTETKPNDSWARYHMTEEKWEFTRSSSESNLKEKSSARFAW